MVNFSKCLPFIAKTIALLKLLSLLNEIIVLLKNVNYKLLITNQTKPIALYLF